MNDLCPTCMKNPVERKSAMGRAPDCEDCKSLSKQRRDARNQSRAGRNRDSQGRRYDDPSIPLQDFECSYCHRIYQSKRLKTRIPVCDRDKCREEHKRVQYLRKKDHLIANYHADPEGRKRRRLQLRLERAGLSIEWYDAQGGRCGICGSDDPKAGGWHIDHDHSCCPYGSECSRCIRGLLCSPCNTALGLMGDDPERLRSAASWVESHRVSLQTEPAR